jgi:hypothetical protein
MGAADACVYLAIEQLEVVYADKFGANVTPAKLALNFKKGSKKPFSADTSDGANADFSSKNTI